MRTLLIWVFTSSLVVVLGEPPVEPFGHIGLNENYSNSYDDNSVKSGTSYGAPVSSGYGAPVSSNYGAPAKASSSYGAPAKASTSYGPPKASYGPPKKAEVYVYGPPKAAPVKHIHHTTVVYVKKGRKQKKSYGKWIWVPRLPRLKVIPHKVQYRPLMIKVQKPRFKFSPPRFVWW